MIIPASREEWESISADELKGYSDKQLKDALQEHFGLRSHVYFMPVAKKREYILNPDVRPTLQAEAEDRQKGHQDRGASHRGKASVATLIAENSEGRQYEFVGVDRPQGGFTDPFSERTGVVAYVVRDVADGAEFPTQKRTVVKLTKLGRLTGYDERISAKKQKPAHKAGAATLEDVIAKNDVQVTEAVAAVVEEAAATAGNIAPVSDEREDELDAILNSIGQ
jgi:hypothetical protein